MADKDDTAGEILEEENNNSVRVEELLLSLVEDVFELLKIVSEENSTKVYNTVLGTKEEAVRSVKTLVGGMVLPPMNYFRVVKLSAKIAKLSGQFVKANVDMLS